MSAVVVGGGVAGLVAAREFALRGEPVTVLEATARLGGMLTGVELAGITIDAGAEAYATRTPVVHELCLDLGLEPVAPQGRSQVWWPDPRGRWPLARGVLGIPGSLTDEAVQLALSPQQIRRAATDLTEPVGRLGASVAEVVSSRLGPAVLERLVAPLTRAVYGRPPEQMALDHYLPDLRQAVVRHQSLLRAVAGVMTDRAVIEQPVGGMYRLVERLTESVRGLGAVVLTGSRAISLARRGRWVVTTATGSIAADRVVVATPARDAARLLAPLGLQFRVPGTGTSRSVLLALAHPGLDPAPVGSGVLVGAPTPQLVAVKALTHYSAKWPWAFRTGRHIVRVALQQDHRVGLTQVLDDSSLLLGIELQRHHLVASHEVVWNQVPDPLPTPERVTLLERVAGYDGLSLAGAWVQGNGLAPVVTAGRTAAA